MSQIYLSTIEEYEYCNKRGYIPLLDAHFRLEISLRIEIQRELFGQCVFGRGEDIQKANERFYRWMWRNKAHQCEETMKPLNNYSSIYISHILTRGAHPEMAHDPRNINILCQEMHNLWENGNRLSMRIYQKNIKTIELLTSEYNASK